MGEDRNFRCSFEFIGGSDFQFATENIRVPGFQLKEKYYDRCLMLVDLLASILILGKRSTCLQVYGFSVFDFDA